MFQRKRERKGDFRGDPVPKRVPLVHMFGARRNAEKIGNYTTKPAPCGGRRSPERDGSKREAWWRKLHPRTNTLRVWTRCRSSRMGTFPQDMPVSKRALVRWSASSAAASSGPSRGSSPRLRRPTSSDASSPIPGSPHADSPPDPLANRIYFGSASSACNRAFVTPSVLPDDSTIHSCPISHAHAYHRAADQKVMSVVWAFHPVSQTYLT